MKVKARKSQERKALKLRVHDGSVVGLVHITIKRKDMYHDFTDEVAIALGSQALYCLEESGYELLLNQGCDHERVYAYGLISDTLKSNSNYKIILELRGLINNYYGILVEDKVYMFRTYVPEDIKAITKKLSKPKVNTYSPDYIMQHIEPKIKELDKYSLVSQELKDKLSLTQVLRNIRISQAKVLSFKKKLHKGRVQL